VWGFVHDGPGTIASYFVHWTLGQVQEHGACFDLVLGQWGEGATPADRVAVSLHFRHLDSGPSFMVVDAKDRPIGDGALAATILSRSEVLGSRWEATVYDVVDAIWLRDARVAEVVTASARS